MSKEEILEKRYPDFDKESGWMFDGPVEEVFNAMDEFANQEKIQEAIKFSEWLGDNGYQKMWLGDKSVGWADQNLQHQDNCFPIEDLYQKFKIK